MKERYTRAEPRNVSGLMSDVLKAVGDKPAFIDLHNLVEMLDVNLIDKYFKQAFGHDPINQLAMLIQYDVIHLYDFSKFLDNTDRKTEPTISKMEQVDKDINVRSKDEPQTDNPCKTCETYWNCQGQCDEIPQIEDEWPEERSE